MQLACRMTNMLSARIPAPNPKYYILIFYIQITRNRSFSNRSAINFIAAGVIRL
jgi:hypothetical protein